MKKLVLPILLTILLVVSNASSGYSFPDYVKEVQFWAPPIMLEGHEYDVTVILADYNPEGVKFDIISNNENIVSVIDREITLEPFKSHGIAKVKTKSVGMVDLFAVSGEKLLTASVEVVEPALMPAKLDIILPSNQISTRQILAYVFLFDSFNNPLRATEDIEVNISSFGNVKTQVSKTVINQGTHYSKFIINIEGGGGIIVAANNLQSDTELIDFGEISDDIDLQVQIAPNILAPSSSGELYAWLEKDGKPFVPDFDVKVVLSSEDSRFLAFSKAVQFSVPLDRDLVSTREIFIKRGTSFAHTMIWTTDFLNKLDQDSEEITVTATSDGVDSALTTVEIREAVKKEPNIAKIFALPDPVFDKLEIIIALYFSAKEEAEREDVQDNENEPTKEEQEEVRKRSEEEIVDEQEDQAEDEDDFQPVFIGESIMAHIATDTLLKPESASIRIGVDDLDKRDHYAVIPAQALGRFGLSKITGTAGGARGDQLEITVEQRYTPIPTINVKPLPILTNVEQDMFLVYMEKDGIMIDSEIKNLVIKTKPTVQFENVVDINTLKVANGKSPTLVPEREIEVTAIAPGFMSSSTKISVSNPELRHIVAYHPSTVHATEPFPVVFYATDDNEHPIEIVEPLVSPTSDFARISKGLYMLSSSSEHNFVFYAEGMNPGTSKIEVFSYGINLEVSANANEFDIGDIIELTYQITPADAKVTLDTDLPFERSNNELFIESTIPGSHTLVITAEKDGFNKMSKEIKIEIGDPAGITTLETKTPDFDVKNFSSDALKSNPTILLTLIGILVVTVGAVLFIFNKRKRKRSPDITPEGDLTFLFRGDSINWNSI